MRLSDQSGPTMIRNAFSNISIFGIFVLLLNGCSLVAIGPAAFVEQPELMTSEKGQNNYVFQSENFHQFNITNNAATRPFVAPTSSKVVDFTNWTAGLHHSLSPDWELGFTGNPMLLSGGFSLSYMLRFSAKYKLFGATGENRLKPGWMGSGYFHFATAHVSASGEQAYLFGPGGYGWKTSSDFNGPSLGFSVGYRWIPKFMMYVGATDQEFSVNGSIHQDPTGDKLYPANDYSFGSQSGSSRTIAAGFIYGVYSQVGLVASHTELLWGPISDSLTSVNFTMSFDDIPKQLPALQPYQCCTK